MQGCRWCSKSACKRLVSLSAHRLAHGSGLPKTGHQMADGARLAQMGWHSSRKNWPIWLRRNGTTFGVSAERARSILVSTMPVVPCPSLDDLLDVCGSFSAQTATGSDNLHPVPHLKHVCGDALRATAMITTLAANFGYCFAVFAIIMVLLPKATCGWRPIGLFTSVLRVYLR